MNHLSDEDTQPALVSTLQTPSSTEDNLTHQLEGNTQENAVKGMCMVQLNDDTIGQVLKQVEANQRPDKSTLSGLGHEARQLYQQWEQLLVQ